VKGELFQFFFISTKTVAVVWISYRLSVLLYFDTILWSIAMKNNNFQFFFISTVVLLMAEWGQKLSVLLYFDIVGRNSITVKGPLSVLLYFDWNT